MYNNNESVSRDTIAYKETKETRRILQRQENSKFHGLTRKNEVFIFGTATTMTVLGSKIWPLLLLPSMDSSIHGSFKKVK